MIIETASKNEKEKKKAEKKMKCERSEGVDEAEKRERDATEREWVGKA